MNGTRGVLTIGAYLVVAMVIVGVAFWGLVKYGVANPAASFHTTPPLPVAELGSTRVQLAIAADGSNAPLETGQDQQRLRVLQSMVAEKTQQLRAQAEQLKATTKDYDELRVRYEEAVTVAVELLAKTGEPAADSTPGNLSVDVTTLQADLDLAQAVQDTLMADVERLQEELARAYMEMEELQQQAERQVADRLRDGMILEAEAANALMALGAAAVPELLKDLANPNPLVRRWAANILSGIGPDAQDALPALTEVLSDSDPGVRRCCALPSTRSEGEARPQAVAESRTLPSLAFVHFVLRRTRTLQWARRVTRSATDPNNK